MRSLAIALLAAVLASSVRAQGQYQGGAAPEEAPAPVPDQSNPPPGDDSPPPSAAMTLDDARTNFSSVIDSFLATHSTDDVWLLRDKSNGQLLRLKLIDKDLKSVTESPEGSQKYKGIVYLRDQVSGDKVRTQFHVDLSGTEWKVTQMVLLGRTPKKKPAAKAKAATPKSAAEGGTPSK